MRESETAKFSVEHQPGNNLRIWDPAFSEPYDITTSTHPADTDRIFYDVLNTDIGKRALGISQLGTGPLEETYHRSSELNRWQHVSGVYRLVRDFGRGIGLDETDITRYAAAACLPDLGHGVKSHATDMMMEGMGGEENFHDLRIAQTLEQGRINQILSANRIKSPFDAAGNATVDIPSWVECSAPGLNVDRLHYINAELAVMFPDNTEIKQATNLENITITEAGEFAFKDIENARIWAKGALICSSEHWNHPIKRLILLKSVEGLKRTIFKRYLQDVDTIDDGVMGQPQDYTFLLDRHFDDALRDKAGSDYFMYETYAVLQSLGHDERERFERKKRAHYENYITDSEADAYPNELINPGQAEFGLMPPMVEVIDHKIEEFDLESGRAFQMIDDHPVGVLKRLKRRQFDPLVVTATGAMKLSELDKNFKSALEQNGMALDYVGAVALHVSPAAREALIDAVNENMAEMEYASSRPPLPATQIREIIRRAGSHALDLSIRQGTWLEAKV